MQANRWFIAGAVVVAASQLALAQGPRRPGARSPTAAPQEAAPAEEPPTPPPAESAAIKALGPAATQPLSDLFTPDAGPLGFAGASPLRAPDDSHFLGRDTMPVQDRWRIGWPTWDRYGRASDDDRILMNAAGGDSPFTLGHPLNPYDRNVLKGDYPIFVTSSGAETFFNATAISDTFVNYRKLPTPSGVSAIDPGAFDFFGDGRQLFVSQTFLLSLELFQGYTAFRPVDWLLRITPAANINYLELRERNAVNIDVREGRDRDDRFITLQEAFFEYHLGDLSHNYDILALRVGRQIFVSDFRGFIFSDVTDGVRLLGNAASNRVQYNLAFFNQNDKDTNSELNELNWRDQQVLIANLYVQDFIWPGYTTQFSFHWNHDQSDLEYDNNGFLVIPDLAGSVTLHDIDAYYLGWAGDGHIGRLNVNHAFYYVFGRDSANPIAGRSVDIDAFMGALELSVDIDWFRPKLSFLYASGDRKPLDGRARGFDGIFDNPFFAGGPSSFYQGSALRLFGVNLVSARSFYNDLAATKGEGQSNFVNPGTILLGAGFDAEITPRFRTSFNANAIWFAHTETLELFLNQGKIRRDAGYELNLSFQYRPLLNNNIIFTAGGSLFFPAAGFEDLYDSDETLYQVFGALTLTY